ncbi:hypothetical protein FA13DRAFT_1876722 [Coprinellus micaceus]|uniref:Uncharacterized protein n=1 Tax=Coprinellus micaceus TaxID=71717 RepID=A0A4Y7S2B5_COPMI|nr:hypothetical protein FA13DRAFT_1876722 [Coprinellus micaceus]
MSPSSRDYGAYIGLNVGICQSAPLPKFDQGASLGSRGRFPMEEHLSYELEYVVASVTFFLPVTYCFEVVLVSGSNLLVWFEKSRLRRHRGASGAESFRFTRELDPKTEWERDYCTALYGRNVTLSQAPLAFLIFTPVTPQTQRRPLKKAILAARLRRDPPKRQVSRSPGVGFLSAALAPQQKCHVPPLGPSIQRATVLKQASTSSAAADSKPLQ